MGFGGNYRVRERGQFDPASKEPYRISRSKIDLFLECPRCFYLDQRLGIGRPDMPAFSLNNAVDTLLKKEFDVYRVKGNLHPLLKSYGLSAVPLKHKDLEKWREARRAGIEYLHKGTNLSVRGGIDDIWEGKDGKLIIVDYKATSKKSELTLYDSYKRQVEVYQWLFRKNDFPVSDTAYFVYVNASTDAEAFDAKLEFKVELIPYTGDTSWIEPALHNIKKCLLSEEIPPKGECDYCPYREAAGKALLARNEGSKKKTGRSTRARKKDDSYEKTPSLF
ncbi:MAG: PD-(D/E)XK nuclease family protein [Patescibacteria group bacterium]|nr:PD-(D/E)XK nuclease family protein [Patescibacteria group bacterium]